MKVNVGKGLLAFLAMALVCTTADAAVIAYWNQNSNDLPNGGFGYQPGDFPQPADVGSGSLDLANFDTTTASSSGGDTVYDFIESFGGTTDNAQFGDAAGGSISPQGGTGGTGNNGMEILLSVDTTGFTDIDVSWAQRGTGTGFDSRLFAYSTDGGSNFTDVAYAGDTGALGSSWDVVSPDLTGIAALNNNPNVVFRITLDGATGSTGNNRFDNILIQGVPEPASMTLFALATMAVGFCRRRS